MSSYSSADDEYDSDEPPELQLDIPKLIELATETFQATCTSAKRLTRGSWHEIFVLQFQAGDSIPFESVARSGYCCMARFARVKGISAKEESEIATIRYLKRHTSIPVPEIYYQDLDPENEVGAAFVLMEKLPGRHLYKTWDDLSLDHKKAVLTEITLVITQFASLRFDKIGSLTNNWIGPVVSPCYESPKGPFDSTLEYLQSFVSQDSVESKALAELFEDIRTELAGFTHKNSATYLEPPFAMIHADLDAQNMLFLQSSDGSGPKLTGLIDFEYAHSGPSYFLYEYPIFIQDASWSKHLYAENAILRAHFVSQIFNHLPCPEAQESFIKCMNSKTYVLNGFHDAFMSMRCSKDTLIHSATYYLKSLKEGTGLAYSGRVDYKPEYYSDRGELVTTTAVNVAQGVQDESQ
ncbi:kinase-like domain-containing protein [Dactylonectria macrodidyma]|uniref:Kinase-like domain-containing protein n=1 Tax=Dactylonectria macrodidyma TaxID=307937 RepID=A0A9P9JHY0_9HYPO|nr:kinase-like domain-containing protein [Dactylonectria macrodidyma]